MFENENIVNDMQEEVVVPQESENQVSSAEDDTQQSGDVATPETDITKPTQSREDNAMFASLRREKEMLSGCLKELGYTGDIKDIALRIEAEKKGTTVEEIKRSEKELEERINADPRIVEAERLRRDATFAKDLQAIKEVYPDCKAESVQELGDIFLNLMQSGKISAVDAYAAQLAHDERKASKIPPKIGEIKSKTPDIKEYYSQEDVDNLSAEELDNPVIRAKIKKSMERW